MKELKIDKKKLKERVMVAMKKYEELKEKGWEETPDGLLPQDEIKKAGFIKQKGEWLIPMKVYIAKVASDGLRKGAKYLGVSMQYINWKDERSEKESQRYESGQMKIDREIKETVVKRDILVPRENNATKVAKQFGGVVVDGEIDVSKMSF